MRVWVVLGHTGYGEDTEVDAVFSTAEAAQAYHEAHRVPDDGMPPWPRWFIGKPVAFDVDAEALAPVR